MTPPASILNGCSHRATPDRWLYGALLTHQDSLSEGGGMSPGTMCRRSYRRGSSSVPEKSGMGTLPEVKSRNSSRTPILWSEQANISHDWTGKALKLRNEITSCLVRSCLHCRYRQPSESSKRNVREAPLVGLESNTDSP
mgnify:CR=1 FL=1